VLNQLLLRATGTLSHAKSKSETSIHAHFILDEVRRVDTVAPTYKTMKSFCVRRRVLLMQCPKVRVVHDFSTADIGTSLKECVASETVTW
jgi:hypothetical protein